MLTTIDIETAPKPTASIVILHGLGADANDFVPFARELDLSSIGPVRFVFPNSPVRPVTVNGGMTMPAWYDILGADLGLDGRRPEDEAGLRASRALVDLLIERETSRGIPASRVVLGGFSQGCAMTLMTGLRHPERLAGLLCMSGYLPLAALLDAERHAANADVPIFQAHGHQDGVIPIARALATRDALVAAGHAVEWHAYRMAHSVCPEEIRDIERWLCSVLAGGAHPPRGE